MSAIGLLLSVALILATSMYPLTCVGDTAVEVPFSETSQGHLSAHFQSDDSDCLLVLKVTRWGTWLTLVLSPVSVLCLFVLQNKGRSAVSLTTPYTHRPGGCFYSLQLGLSIDFWCSPDWSLGSSSCFSAELPQPALQLLVVYCDWEDLPSFLSERLALKNTPMLLWWLISSPRPCRCKMAVLLSHCYSVTRCVTAGVGCWGKRLVFSLLPLGE